MFDRITIDPNICHGTPCIKGTRVPVHQVVGALAAGDTIDDVLQSYHIERLDVLEALRFAARMTEEELDPVEAVAQ